MFVGAISVPIARQSHYEPQKMESVEIHALKAMHMTPKCAEPLSGEPAFQGKNREIRDGRREDMCRASIKETPQYKGEITQDGKLLKKFFYKYWRRGCHQH
jgi:hypothetical protein